MSYKPKKSHAGLNAERGWDYYDTKFIIDNSGNIYGGDVVIRKSANGKDYFYDLDNIEIIETDPSGVSTRLNPIMGRSSEQKISQTAGEVKQDTEDGFSRNIFGKTESMADLRAENEALREKLDDYNKIKEQLASAKRQLTITEKPTHRKEDIRKFTKERIDYYNSAANVNDITEQMQELGDFIVQGGKTGVLDYTEVKDKARFHREHDEIADFESFRVIPARAGGF